MKIGAKKERRKPLFIFCLFCQTRLSWPDNAMLSFSTDLTKPAPPVSTAYLSTVYQFLPRNFKKTKKNKIFLRPICTLLSQRLRDFFKAQSIVVWACVNHNCLCPKCTSTEFGANYHVPIVEPKKSTCKQHSNRGHITLCQN